jgi:hypothetical protein|tara:strand:- start:2142 stop:2399 length:258 start_codon:yes stop_codon:yes gene_type:complete
MSEVETTPTLDFISALQGGDYNSAQELFNGILGGKMQDTLDAEKVAVADSIFNGVEPVDMEMTDEEVDDVLGSEVSEEEDSSEIA